MCSGLDFKFVFYLFQLNVQTKQEIQSVSDTSHLVEYLKPNKNDEIKKNNKNTDENGCHRFSGFDVHTTDYFIFFKLER